MSQRSRDCLLEMDVSTLRDIRREETNVPRDELAISTHVLSVQPAMSPVPSKLAAIPEINGNAPSVTSVWGPVIRNFEG